MNKPKSTKKAETEQVNSGVRTKQSDDFIAEMQATLTNVKNEYDYDWSEIGTRIDKLREKNGIGKVVLAKILGVSINAPGQEWAKGKKLPDLGTLLKLCKLFGVELRYLLGEQEGETKEITDIMKETGLSKSSIAKLRGLKDNDDYQSKRTLEVINALLDSSAFDEVCNKIFAFTQFIKVCTSYEMEYPEINSPEKQKNAYITFTNKDREKKKARAKEVHEVKKLHLKANERGELSRYYAEKSFSRFIDDYSKTIKSSFNLESFLKEQDELEDDIDASNMMNFFMTEFLPSPIALNLSEKDMLSHDIEEKTGMNVLRQMLKYPNEQNNQLTITFPQLEGKQFTVKETENNGKKN